MGRIHKTMNLAVQKQHEISYRQSCLAEITAMHTGAVAPCSSQKGKRRNTIYKLHDIHSLNWNCSGLERRRCITLQKSKKAEVDSYEHLKEGVKKQEKCICMASEAIP